MIFRRSLETVAALVLMGTSAEAQHHTMGSNPIPTANNPIHQGDGFGTGYNNPLSQGVGFGTGYNNPISQGVGFGTGYNDPLQQGVGFGTGYNNPLQQNGSLNPSNPGRRVAGSTNSLITGAGGGGTIPIYAGPGYGVGSGYLGNQGYGGLGGWNSYDQGYGYGGGYYNPLNQGFVAGGNGNQLIPNGLDPAAFANDAGGPRSNAAVSAALNGTNPPPKRAARSKSSKSGKRATRRR